MYALRAFLYYVRGPSAERDREREAGARVAAGVKSILRGKSGRNLQRGQPRSREFSVATRSLGALDSLLCMSPAEARSTLEHLVTSRGPAAARSGWTSARTSARGARREKLVKGSGRAGREAPPPHCGALYGDAYTCVENMKSFRSRKKT